jgi:hypothetical protein
MATYQVVCVNTEHPHRHITHVGLGSSPQQYTSRLTVAQVRSMIREGHRFITYSPSTGKTAEVRPDDCKYAGCTIKTIRTTADAIADNNLDNMRLCRT